MKYYLEKSNDDLHSVVIRGNDAQGKPYRLFVKIDGQVIKIDPRNWIRRGDKDFDRDKFVRKNPILNTFLKDLKRTLEEKVTVNKIQNPLYSIPDAWMEIYPGSKTAKDQLSDFIVEVVEPFKKDNRVNKSKEYLRHFDQLKDDIGLWNPKVKFANLNELTLKSYHAYLKGEGEPKRKVPLKSGSIGNRFKHLRQLSKYAVQRKIEVDPKVFDYKTDKVIYELGCFDLTFDELMILWHYKPENEMEETALGHSLFEAFTGIRTGDLYSLKDDGTEHGVKCGDITDETIIYRDRKNHDLVKTVTRHKFNSRIIEKYISDDSNRLLLPPITYKTGNAVIKKIAKKAGLTRGIRRGNIIRPMHEVISSHCFRASYGNLLFRIGVPTEMISEELGHAAMSVTVKHYLKFSERHEIIREKINALEIALPKKETQMKSA